jgi:dUTP pyrophosphatase
MYRKKEPLKVNFKKLVAHAVTPTYAKEGDAGLDLTAIDYYRNIDYKYVEFGTGLSVEIPEGYVGLVFPRSSISKTSHTLANSVGVIDSGYRSEIKLRMRYDDNNEDMEYMVGDRVGQLVIMPYEQAELTEVQNLPETERTGGFGSTGR